MSHVVFRMYDISQYLKCNVFHFEESKEHVHLKVNHLKKCTQTSTVLEVSCKITYFSTGCNLVFSSDFVVVIFVEWTYLRD